MSNPSKEGVPVIVQTKAPMLAHTHLEKANLPLEELVMFQYQTRQEQSIIPGLNIQMLSSCHLHLSPYFNQAQYKTIEDSLCSTYSSVCSKICPRYLSHMF